MRGKIRSMENLNNLDIFFLVLIGIITVGIIGTLIANHNQKTEKHEK